MPKLRSRRIAASAVSLGLAASAIPFAATSVLAAATGDCPVAAGAYASGAGVPADPYVISTPAEMQRLWETSADWGASFLLTANIDMTGDPGLGICQWDAAIGNGFIPFSGTFDGDNFTVSELNVSITETGTPAFVGMFGVISATATVQDLKLDKIGISANGDGEVAGGALVGRNSGAVSNIAVTNSSVAATSTGGDTGSNPVYAGGIAGLSDVATTIQTVDYQGTVTGAGKDDVHAGGAVGVNQGALTFAQHDGAVSATSTESVAYAGGIVGLNTGDITTAIAAGTVGATSTPDAGDTDRDAYAGGIVGSSSSATGVVSGGASTSAVSASGNSAYAGGFAGSLDDAATDSVATGNATANASTRPAGQAFAGGFAGYANDAPLDRIAATGNATATSTATNSEAFAGGIIGFTEALSVVNNAYALGNPSASATDTAGVGGAVGSNAGTWTKTYVVGAPVASTATNQFVGGFAGTNTGDATDSFWDGTTSAATNAVGSGSVMTSVTENTTGAMQTIAIYNAATWDISDGYDPAKTWFICPAFQGGYPALSALTASNQCMSVTPSGQIVSAYTDIAITPTSTLTANYFSSAPVTYTIAPALPAGLSMDANTGVITGTPTATLPATVFTVTGTAGAEEATATVTITVSDPSLSPATQSIETNMNAAITPTAALVAEGFPGTVGYTIAPALPAGLTLDSTTGVISGTPTVAQATATHTITGTDGVKTATTAVDVTVNPQTLDPATQTIAGLKDVTIAPTTAYTAGGFDGDITYSIAPALPAGLSLDPATGVVSGTPTEFSAAAAYTVTASAGAQSQTATINISVSSANLSPLTQTVTENVNAPIAPTAAMTADSFAGDVVYTVFPELPAGLSIDDSTGVISGTPTVAIPETVFTITGTSGTQTATATVTMTILAQSLTPETQSVEGVPLVEIVPTQPYVANNFDDSVAYTISPALPSGLVMDDSTGVISGTPDADSPLTTYTITGTAGAQSATATVEIAVGVPALSPSSQTVLANVNSAIATTTPITAENFPGTVTFTIAPALPAGLAFDDSTGVISGTAIDPLPETVFTITGSDGSKSADATVTMTILAQSLFPESQVLEAIRKVEIVPTQAYVANNFDGEVTYTVSPSLPEGLSIDEFTGVIFGKPTKNSPLTTYVVTATAGAQTATATVDILVRDADPTPDPTPTPDPGPGPQPNPGPTPGPLPVTGSDMLAPVGLGALFILAGLALIGFTMRRGRLGTRR